MLSTRTAEIYVVVYVGFLSFVSFSPLSVFIIIYLYYYIYCTNTIRSLLPSEWHGMEEEKRIVDKHDDTDPT